MIEAAGHTVPDIFFNFPQEKQFDVFRLMLINMLVWGSYLPITAYLGNNLKDMALFSTINLTIVYTMITHQGKTIRVYRDAGEHTKPY